MPKYLLDLWLDGYNSPEEEESACSEFISDQLDISSSSVEFELLTETPQGPTIKQLSDLWNICQKFVQEQKPTCSESIYQVDSINLATPELVQEICECVGYYKYKEDSEDEK